MLLIFFFDVGNYFIASNTVGDRHICDTNREAPFLQMTARNSIEQVVFTFDYEPLLPYEVTIL